MFYVQPMCNRMLSMFVRRAVFFAFALDRDLVLPTLTLRQMVRQAHCPLGAGPDRHVFSAKPARC